MAGAGQSLPRFTCRNCIKSPDVREKKCQSRKLMARGETSRWCCAVRTDTKGAKSTPGAAPGVAAGQGAEQAELPRERGHGDARTPG